MGRARKRTRTTSSISSISGLHIKEEMRGEGPYQYLTHCVQGWKEDGKWKRKRFKSRKDAEDFIALKQIELTNQGRKQRTLLTSLTEDQLDEAEIALKTLGDTYTLREAVDYFLANHRPPEHTIELKDAIKTYIDECERSGIRPRTITQKQSVLNQFADELHNPLTHLITRPQIESYLRGLRSKDGTTPATRKTWNNYRNDINHFFSWACEADLRTQRPYTFINPVEGVLSYSAKQIAAQRRPIAITPPRKLQRRLTALMKWKDGDLVKYFALAYFAGIRPNGELGKLSKRENELINLETRTIHIPANVSKTNEERQIRISDNLLKWLVAYADKPILPTNHNRLIKRARQAFKLQHDETRHTFISYHVALNRSIGEAALQAGNSENIVKKHYLNLRPEEEGKFFFAISPNRTLCKSVVDESVAEYVSNKLRIV